LTFDNTTSELVANGAGTLLLVDYRLPDKKPAADTSPMAGNMRPSQTAFAWTQRMQFNPDTHIATFDEQADGGAVRMGHRGPDSVMLLPDGSVELRPNTTPAILNCQRLTCQFVAAKKDPAKTPTPPAAGGLAGRTDTAQDLKSVLAKGKVYLRQPDKAGDMTLLCDFLRYDKDTDTVLFGRDSGEAEIFRIAPDGSRFNHLKAPRIEWCRATGRIEPFKGSFEGAGGR
ncbi:MAG: hypothetical protein PHU85_16085, partial [Phycisphaerae bacterium]|nr:hypothetical protein [Phycisphaerae bacterium]